MSIATSTIVRNRIQTIEKFVDDWREPVESRDPFALIVELTAVVGSLEQSRAGFAGGIQVDTMTQQIANAHALGARRSVTSDR